MRIILIAGKARSGKTKLGEYIVNYALQKDLRAVQTEYSKYLKLFAKEILGYDGSRENKPRKFLQDLGSFIRCDLGDEDFFTRRMLEDLKVYETFCDIVVISDVRLIKELENLKNSTYKVTTIKVTNQHLEYNLDEMEKNHITEKELEDYENFDYIIENDDLNKLKSFAKFIIEGEK